MAGIIYHHVLPLLLPMAPHAKRSKLLLFLFGPASSARPTAAATMSWPTLLAVAAVTASAAGGGALAAAHSAGGGFGTTAATGTLPMTAAFAIDTRCGVRAGRLPPVVRRRRPPGLSKLTTVLDDGEIVTSTTTEEEDGRFDLECDGGESATGDGREVGTDGALREAATALVGGDQEEEDAEDAEDAMVLGEDKGGDDLYDDMNLPSSLSLLLRQKSRDLLGSDLFDREVLTQRGKELLSRDALTQRSKDLLALVASKVLSPESARAVRTVREIISRFEDDHGVVDVFSRYPSRDVIASILALSRLQRASVAAEEMMDAPPSGNKGCAEGEGDPPDVDLLGDLARYSVFANAAYGWKGGLALSGRLHFGDLKTLISRTGIREQDVVMAEWRSQTHRPAFFIVRDTERKNLVVCIRGTLSAKDVLTDLCATADDFSHDGSVEQGANVTANTNGGGGCDGDASPLGMGFGDAKRRRSRAHHGMLEGAKGVALAARETVSRELAQNPDYDLVIVGHSLGAGTAACLGTIWEGTFPGSHCLSVYAYGCPCVGPIDANPTLNGAIVSVVGEGDPFSNLSLGHLADVTAAISQLCEDETLRTEVLRRTKGGIDGMSVDDLRWCSSKMDRLREAMTAEKFYPPGRIFHMGGANFGNGEVTLREVCAEKFRDLMLHPFMFDLSRHVPNRYEAALTRLWTDVTGKHVLEEK